MASRLRLSILALATLSILLSIATLGCAARSLSVFNTSHTTNAWLLPIWPNHFDTRGLATLVGTSSAILVLNAVLIVGVVVPRLPANIIILLSSAFSTILSLLALIFPAVLNNQAPNRATLQTWTCKWSAASSILDSPHGPGSGFTELCKETRFAFYTQIPLLLLQLLLLALAIFALLGGQKNSSSNGRRDLEKGDGHELGRYGRQGSLEDQKSDDGSARVLNIRGKS